MANKKPKIAAPTKEAVSGEVEELRTRLAEAEETLEAIRSGAVDAIVVSGKAGEHVYTLQGADESYRHLVESISEGIVTLSGDGTILYSNKQFSRVSPGKNYRLLFFEFHRQRRPASY
jgi:PAS domain-containing protein